MDLLQDEQLTGSEVTTSSQEKLFEIAVNFEVSTFALIFFVSAD
jgi:hypothetical protein